MTHSPLVVPLALATCLLLGCAHDFRPPTPNEPHAQIKLRLAYRTWPGPLVEQVVRIDGGDLRELPQPTPQAAGGAASHQVMVRPGTLGLAVRATFFHNDVTTHAETYDTIVEAPCGTGTCKQSTPRTRLVNRTDRVDDAACEQGRKLVAKAGESYVLEFDFQADKQCTLKCHRQGRHGKGSPANLPCDDPATTR